MAVSSMVDAMQEMMRRKLLLPDSRSFAIIIIIIFRNVCEESLYGRSVYRAISSVEIQIYV